MKTEFQDVCFCVVSHKVITVVLQSVITGLINQWCARQETDRKHQPWPPLCSFHKDVRAEYLSNYHCEHVNVNVGPKHQKVSNTKQCNDTS